MTTPQTGSAPQAGPERSRRQLLRWLGGWGTVGVLGAISTADSAAVASEPVTIDRWRATRREPVLVAHRGSGDTLPEHTMEAYQAAFDWGAEAMEISVGITADGVLVCMHDATLDRTTDGTGRIDQQPVSVLDGLRVVQPRLGEFWVRNAPRIPRFIDVLDRFGGSVVLCLEAKNQAAYAPMMAAVVARGLQRSVMVKAHHASPALARAAAAGYPRFAYLGAPSEVTAVNLAAMKTTLDPSRDVLVIPAGSGDPERPHLADRWVAAAVATGVPVWVFPVHRRSEAQHFFDRGVRGAVCAGYGWVAGAVAPARRDAWSGQRVAPGELGYAPTTAPTWTADGELVLSVPGRPQFVLAGQFCPLPGGTIDVDVQWTTAADRSDAVVVTIGHDDDRYHETGRGVGTGYDVLLTRSGALSIQLHRDGRETAVELAAVATAPLPAGSWAHLTIEIDADTITVRRTDTGHRVSTNDRTARGGYLHLGRYSTGGVVAFRRLSTS